jgi:hypothetical protein
MVSFKSKQLNSYHYLGAIHIHSIFSDGTGNIDKISKMAKKAGLDWIIITDHNSFEIQEGFYNGVCVIRGEEISPNDDNHYLAFGINKYIEPTEPKEYVEKVREQGGFGFVAHPDEGVNKNGELRKNSHKPIKWLDKEIVPDGVEIWNWFSQWGDNLNDKNLFTLAYSYLFRNNLVNEPNRETLNWWDKLNLKGEKIFPAIGGVDAHALKITNYIIPVTIFPYEKMFKTITNVLTLEEPLSNDFEIRKNQILKAIKNGNNLIINRAVENSIPEINIIGGMSYKLSDFPYLHIKTSKKSSIKVLLNGKEFYTKITNRLNLLLKEVGKYRVEIKVGDKGFVYTNPILVY